jgi:quercetin dioxygenase-like cupin family protein
MVSPFLDVPSETGHNKPDVTRIRPVINIRLRDSEMEVSIQRWQKSTPPSEAELRQIYRQEGLNPYTWSNAPHDTYAAHAHGYNKVLFVLRGSITWILPDVNQEIETLPGDRLDLPAGVRHAARVGPKGVTCLEAHRG